MTPKPPTPWPALLRFARDVAIVLLVAVVTALALSTSFGSHGYGDLGVFRDAGQAVLDGVSPYPPAVAASFRDQDAFVYPAPAAVAMVPFALVPLPVAGVVFLVLSYAALLLAMRLAGVRSWRFAALALCSVTVLQSMVLGTVTPLLALACAAAWRYRDRRVVAASAIALAIVVKLYLAPLLLWFVITGRRGTAALGAGMALALAAVGWAVIGFRGLREYPTILRLLVDAEGHRGFSTAALGRALGLGPGAARVVAAALAFFLVAAAAGRARGPMGDARAFTLVVVACLVASPIVWLDYQVLLIVPIALLAPRPSWLWLALPASWLYEHHNGVVPVWRIVLAQAVLAALAGAAAAYGARRATGSPARATALDGRPRSA